jgi:hypothetical protein
VLGLAGAERLCAVQCTAGMAVASGSLRVLNEVTFWCVKESANDSLDLGSSVASAASVCKCVQSATCQFGLNCNAVSILGRWLQTFDLLAHYLLIRLCNSMNCINALLTSDIAVCISWFDRAIDIPWKILR